jgi:hypothetical protein
LTHQRGDIAQIDGLGDLQQFIVFSQNINVISKTRSHDSLQKRFNFSFSDNDTAPKPCPIHERQLEQIRSVRRIGWKRGAYPSIRQRNRYLLRIVGLKPIPRVAQGAYRGEEKNHERTISTICCSE